ncbi:hypothetical protein QTP70_004882 [Hemibagrus guttatus]|uniref:Reelin domain-containing protein n=1 Tax=Hemibagrus guttatus TaxID=175788 RepID=A0AAE0RAB1_9TELE|nr:hypothetical protein QTP70_004882 [Hemibagrus guttatus]
MSEQQFGTQFVCSVVASHVSRLPTTSFSFVWIAPPPGTGCINFLATAMHRGQILFKDTLAKQLCELEVAVAAGSMRGAGVAEGQKEDETKGRSKKSRKQSRVKTQSHNNPKGKSRK